jgi:predicted alpha/beta superfamily hydrolase
MKPLYLIYLLLLPILCKANPADSLTLVHIGTSCAIGIYQVDSGKHTLYGSGGDIWNTVDEFDFASKKIKGDVQIMARLKSAELHGIWVKAGIMFREGLYPFSRYGYTLFYGNNTFSYQSRAFNGAGCNVTKTRNLNPPYWIKLIRKGNLMISQISPDKTTWKTIGVETIELPDSLYAGLAVCSSSACNPARTEFDSVSISGYTEPISPEIQKLIITNHRMHSTYVNDDFMIFINLPLSYDSLPQKHYPVVYYLDGNSPDYHNNLRTYAASHLIPEVISVSIGYPGLTQRTRDYTYGFNSFHSFLKQELIPYIDARYRTDRLNRTLFGNSFGGICTLFTLFNYIDPTDIPFQNLIVSSPSIWWPSDGQATFALERTLYNVTKVLPVNLYMTIGSEETAVMISDFYKMSDTLTNRHYKSFNFKYKLDQGQTHTSNSNVTFSEGIPWILNEPLPKVLPDVIKGYTDDITIKLTGNLLQVRVNNSGKINIQLLDVLGRIRHVARMDSSVDIDVSNYEKGIYIVKLSGKILPTIQKIWLP